MSEVELRGLVGNGIALEASTRHGENVDSKVGMAARRAVIVEVATQGGVSRQRQ